jgi:hypothetical protein
VEDLKILMQSPFEERCSVLRYTFEKKGQCKVDIADLEKLLALGFKIVQEKKLKEKEEPLKKS